MIEFKAECGHTVRAKDGAAGGTVRCSYCGCQVEVPGVSAGGLDFLFNEVEKQPEEVPARRRRKGPKSKRIRARASSTRRFDPFSVIVRMCYVALLLIVVIVVGRKYVRPMFEDNDRSGRVAAGAEESLARPVPSLEPVVPTQRRGLIAGSAFPGLLVASSPPGATVYCRKESPDTAGDGLEAFDATSTRMSLRGLAGDDVVRGRANGGFLRLENGRYVVEMALPWNAPQLNDPDLPNHSAYISFRRAIDVASDEECPRLIEEYFVPDGADAVFIDRTPEQIFLVRRYRGVEVRGGKSGGVRSLFLPRLTPPGQSSFSIVPLVKHYIPKGAQYGFMEDYVRNELDFWEVPVPDRLVIIEALHRIGIIPYVTPDGQTRLFKIGIEDGTFAALAIGDVKP